MSTAAIRRYWTILIVDGCILSGAPAEIAHCHGGSIVERMKEPHAKGRKLARYDWLVLPLAPFWHRLGKRGEALDLDVELWEALNGTQASMIDRLAEKHGIDLWAKAHEGRK